MFASCYLLSIKSFYAGFNLHRSTIRVQRLYQVLPTKKAVKAVHLRFSQNGLVINPDKSVAVITDGNQAGERGRLSSYNLKRNQDPRLPARPSSHLRRPCAKIEHNLVKVQRPQNALACFATFIKHTDHIRPVVQKLNWLLINSRQWQQ